MRPVPKGGLDFRPTGAIVRAVPVTELDPQRVALRAVVFRAAKAAGLSEREAEVLALVAAGLSNGEVAGELAVAPATVKKHLENVYGRLGVRSRGAAVACVLAAALANAQVG